MVGPAAPAPEESSRVLWLAGLAAFLVEAGILTAAGWHSHWLAHPPNPQADESRFIEAQVYETPPAAHLVDHSKPTPVVAKRHAEAVISKVPSQGRAKKAEEAKPAAPEENVTEAGPKFAPSHGPIAIFSPPPVIPSYLRSQDLHASVVIDFFVTGQGVATPHLVSSSGSEELDAIAIAAAKKWQFRPAEKDHAPVDARVRLRIVFEVQ